MTDKLIKVELKREETIALIKLIDMEDLTPNEESLLRFLSSKLKVEVGL